MERPECEMCLEKSESMGMDRLRDAMLLILYK